MTIKEHLNKLDIASDNKYDLYSLYECIDFTADERKDFHDILEQEEDAEVIYKHLVNRFGDRDFSCIREDVNDFEYIADEFHVTGPDHRGARMPEFNKYAFNVSAIPDNMRPKYYQIIPSNTGVHFEWVTQEPFSLDDAQKFIDEVKRSFTAFADLNHIYALFPVNIEIVARDGAEYGSYTTTVYIDTRGTDDEDISEEGDEMILDEAFDEIYASEYSALDDDIEILYDRYHLGNESPANILTDLGYTALDDNDDIFVKINRVGDTEYKREINLTPLDTSNYITYSAYVNDEIPAGFTITKTNLYEDLNDNDSDILYLLIYKDNDIDEFECISHKSEDEAETKAERLSRNKKRYSDIRIEPINADKYHKFINSDDYFDFMETGDINI